MRACFFYAASFCFLRRSLHSSCVRSIASLNTFWELAMRCNSVLAFFKLLNLLRRGLIIVLARGVYLLPQTDHLELIALIRLLTCPPPP